MMRAYGGPLLLIAAVVVVAFIVNRFAPQQRQHVRRAAVLLVLYLLARGIALALPLLGAESWAPPVRVAAQLLGAFTGVTLAGVVLFDVVLPALRIQLANIVTDLSIGLAFVIATLVVLRHGGVDFSSIVATSAVVTAVLALSMQATLGNVIGGVALQLDRSVRVGDWIQLENGRQGRIAAIRWRHTVLETRDWDTIIVPNSSLLAANIVLLGKRDGVTQPHRMWVHFNVDFRYPPHEVIDAVQEALRGTPIEGVASAPLPDCICYNFAGEGRHSFAWYSVRFWITDMASDDPPASRVRERIYAALKRANIPLAVPAAHLWVEQDSQERRDRKAKREIDRRVQALRAVEFLRPLTDNEIADVAQRLHYAPFAAKETITRQGAIAHWLYILAEGEVDILIKGSNGAEQVVAKVVAPSFFGEMGLMTGEPRRASVRAVTDVECYRLDKDAFHSIISQRPEMAAEISALLATRNVELQTAREHLDAAAKKRRVEAERNRLLGTIQVFFGLDS
jgi:small-conductance mechanosensitive channel